MIYSFHYQNETLIAIKAPHGTTLEVPDPDEVMCSCTSETEKEKTKCLYAYVAQTVFLIM